MNKVFFYAVVFEKHLPINFIISMEERIIKVILINTDDGFGFHQDFKPHQK